MAKPILRTGELPTDVRSTLERIESCAGQELPHYPKRTDTMTADEQAIVRVASEAVGRLLFCEGQARDALRALDAGATDEVICRALDECDPRLIKDGVHHDYCNRATKRERDYQDSMARAAARKAGSNG